MINRGFKNQGVQEYLQINKYVIKVKLKLKKKWSVINNDVTDEFWL